MKNIITILSILFMTLSSKVYAESMWGYSGTINVPNAKVINIGDFNIGAIYFIRNNTLSGTGHLGVLPGLEIGIIGGLPISNFQGLVGDVKYQLIKPTTNNPTSVAIGAMFLGTPSSQNYNNFVMGNNLYLVLSHDFQWYIDGKLLNILNTNIGFSGNIEGARIIGGIDIPITSMFNISAEYVGKNAKQGDYFNFGFKFSPLPALSISIYSLGLPDRSFFDREYALGLTYSGELLIKKNENIASPSSTSPTPVPTSTPSIASPTSSIPSIISPPPIIQDKQDNIENNGILKGKILNLINNKEIEEANISILKEDKEIKKVSSDKDGLFTVDNLVEGEYKILVNKTGFESDSKNIIIKKNKVTETVIQLKPKLAEIVGQVTDENKKPIEELTVEIVDTNIVTKTDKQGKYVITSLAPGKYKLNFSKNNKVLKTIEITLSAGEQRNEDINITLNQVIEKRNKSNITGTITNLADKSPISGARIIVENNSITIMTISGLDGTFILKDLPPGKYKITVSKTGFKTNVAMLTLESNKDFKAEISLKKE